VCVCAAQHMSEKRILLC